MGSSLWGWIPIASFSKNSISASGVFSSHFPSLLENSYVFNIWRAYLLRVKLVSPSPVNSPTVVFSMWHTNLLSSLVEAFFFLFGPRARCIISPMGARFVWSWEESPLTYFLRCPFWTNLSIYFLSWRQSSVWFLKLYGNCTNYLVWDPSHPF